MGVSAAFMESFQTSECSIHAYFDKAVCKLHTKMADPLGRAQTHSGLSLHIFICFVQRMHTLRCRPYWKRYSRSIARRILYQIPEESMWRRC